MRFSFHWLSATSSSEYRAMYVFTRARPIRVTLRMCSAGSPWSTSNITRLKSLMYEATDS